jgi:hypothetical protein
MDSPVGLGHNGRQEEGSSRYVPYLTSYITVEENGQYRTERRHDRKSNGTYQRTGREDNAKYRVGSEGILLLKIHAAGVGDPELDSFARNRNFSTSSSRSRLVPGIS